MYKFYHNPRCSKSRAALEYLAQNNHEVEVIEYLNEPLSKEDILRVLAKLTVAKHLLVRTSDEAFERFKEVDLTQVSEAEIAEILLKEPKLMQRPILESHTKAAIARPLADMVAILA